MQTPHLDAFLQDLADGRMHPGHLAAVLTEMRAQLDAVTAAVGCKAPANAHDVPAEPAATAGAGGALDAAEVPPAAAPTKPTTRRAPARKRK
jgi:hypothetical protein